MAALVTSLVASFVSVLRVRDDFGLALFPQCVALLFIVAACASLTTGSRIGAAFAAAAVGARLADTFDLVVIRGVSITIVADTSADVIVLASLAVALIFALLVVFPLRDGVRASASSLHEKVALADEWDD